MVSAASEDDVSVLLEAFLVQLMTLCEGEAMSHFVGLDLSLPQIRVLCALGHTTDPAPIHEVAEGLGLSTATAGRNVECLVQEGLVVRQEDRDDRRVKRVALSDKGSELLSAHLDFRRDILRAFTERLTPAQQHGLRAALLPILAGDALRGTTKEAPDA
jgi:DNA-binding MarR family transcriptional regulator